ncbi:DUF3375 domain-containing protein [Lysobacter capsici]|uniref:DUF3375 domain-containing protein n=1 Tax=Lysobacter capsici TaxID=435897 RepID=UPI000BBA5D01|nr:DUF3375 domain-containing protein [Lysobacter capsici]ATE71280.1 hypothetical protein CNO08_07865 [Lysobacter capsici]
MDRTILDRTQSYLLARHQHPAWQLLASRRAPLVLSCLQTLFEKSHDGVSLEDALQSLASLLSGHAGQLDRDGEENDPLAAARKELRGWIKRQLIVERDNRLYATDALDTALRFVEDLGERIMTSTASRLSVVQREIEDLAARLNPDPASRADRIRNKIAGLERELADALAGRVETPNDQQISEGIRELYVLASGLRADFRRVEDSWRQADRELRTWIVNEQHHRGDIVDSLLDGHDRLLETAEGRVFQGFQQQLSQEIELDQMKRRLRMILRHPGTATALNRVQQADLRWLVMRLVMESGSVIRARARSESDVKSFLKTGLAAEHHRVGALLNEVFSVALELSWTPSLRRKASPLPVLAPANSNLSVIERLRFKSADSTVKQELELKRKGNDLNRVEDDFWASFDSLDREALMQETLKIIVESEKPLSTGELAQRLPPSHDLETLALWIGMAREAGSPITEPGESVQVADRHDGMLRFHVPSIEFFAPHFEDFKWEP